MKTHLTLSDTEFEAQFSNCALPAALFSHEAHLRLAWIHLKAHGLEKAERKVCTQILAFVRHLGAEDKYDKALTVSAIRLVHHFMQKTEANTFSDFIIAFPRLKSHFREVLTEEAHHLKSKAEITQDLYRELAAAAGSCFSVDRKRWAVFIIEKDIDLNKLLPLFHLDHPTSTRVSWIFGDICDKKPEKIRTVQVRMFQERNTIKIPQYDRSIAKFFEVAGIPEEIEGEAVDQMFKWLLDPNIKVATKNYSLTALLEITKKYPDLKLELKEVIEDQYDMNPVSFKWRAKKALKKLS